MARSRTPDPLSRRHLLERELAPAAALRVAEAYLAEGRILEAVEFLAKAGATDKLAELRREAVAAGDVFALRGLAAAMKAGVERDEWMEIAAAASAAGKQLYAEQAQRQAQRGEG